MVIRLPNGQEVVHQGYLEQVVRDIFKGQDIISNVKKDVNVTNPITGRYLELDIWLPTLDIGFEFQDPHHYVTTWECNSPLENVRGKDELKQEIVRSKGIALLVIPCWWDSRPQSLLASLAFRRPDLAVDDDPCSLIPLNPPPRHFLGSSVPDIGELMLASFPYTPEFISTISRDNSWWMGEKYDGIRCCWNSKTDKLYNRSGGVIDLPDSVFEHLCAAEMFLDCEIWFGREYFSDSQLILTADHEDVEWSTLRLITFDEPPVLTSNDLFETRYYHLISQIPSNHPFMIQAPRILCSSPKHVTDMLADVISDGGEGIILRKTCSFYFCGRSSELFKLKATRGDQEALVLESKRDSITLQQADGETFQVSTEALNPMPKRGDIVTFTYQNVTQRSIPSSPKIIRIRTDVTWEQVLRNAGVPQPQKLNEPAAKAVNVSRKPHKYWVSEKGDKMRMFFERLAKSKGLDPLDPDSWYTIAQSDMNGLQGARSILKAYNGSTIAALMDLFPDIGLDEAKFSIVRHDYWKQVKNRRRYFEAFAKEKKFDPLVAENWYSISDELSSAKKASSLLSRYGGSIISALVHLFPEVQFDMKKFDLQTFWKSTENRRGVFEKLAKRLYFNPLVAESWYEVPYSEFTSTSGMTTVLLYHRGGYIKALTELFPEVRFDEIKFSDQYGKFWRESRNRRLFLESFAASRMFDPLLSESWSTITKDALVPARTARYVLSYHEGSLRKALQDLFPEVRFDGEYWNKVVNRRKFIFTYARRNKFDPRVPTNWYNITVEKFLSAQGASFVLRYYSNSLVKALMHLLPEIGLEPLKFTQLPKKFWMSTKNRRMFFEEYAKARGFDPLLASNWYGVTASLLQSFNRGKSVLEYYHWSVPNALHDVFPSIGLDTERFTPEKISWKDPQQRRRFFENFAKEHHFDPLYPENWYAIKLESLMNAKSARSIFSYYGNSLSRALKHLFPEITVEDRKFNFVPTKHWSDEVSRRSVLAEFASKKGFDPLNPENWYSISPTALVSYKKAASMLAYYNLDVSEALFQLFPDIAFSKDRYISSQTGSKRSKG